MKGRRKSGRRIPKYQRQGPSAPGLPSERDISVFDSLDELHAVKVFLGKDLEQAESLFRENFIYYQEDLLFMGPKAFRFYVVAAINYLLSEHSSGNTDAASTFCSIIQHRLEHEPEAVAPASTIIRDGIAGILTNFDRFGFGDQDMVYIYGDVEGRYRDLLLRLAD